MSKAIQYYFYKKKDCVNLGVMDRCQVVKHEYRTYGISLTLECYVLKIFNRSLRESLNRFLFFYVYCGEGRRGFFC